MDCPQVADGKMVSSILGSCEYCILNKQSRRADKVLSSSLGDGRGAKKASQQKVALLRSRHTCLGHGLIHWYILSNGKRGLGWRSG
jgi:hypothetical protein